jgi:hypothetical protein
MACTDQFSIQSGIANVGGASIDGITESEIYTHLRLTIRNVAKSLPRTSPSRTVSRAVDNTKEGRPYYQLKIGSSADEDKDMLDL